MHSYLFIVKDVNLRVNMMQTYLCYFLARTRHDYAVDLMVEASERDDLGGKSSGESVRSEIM
jgi:hypothetical protein